MSSLKDKILSADDLPSETVYVPEWDVDVKIVGLNGKQRGRIMDRVLDQKTRHVDMEKLEALLLVQSLRDPEDDSYIFQEADIDDLQKKSSKAIQDLTFVAMHLSGFGENIVDEAGKGSSPATNGSTQTVDSPST